MQRAAEVLGGVSVLFGTDALRPVIQLVVREVLDQLRAADERFGDGRLAYSEVEAAPLLGLTRFQLRDERIKGRIAHSKGPKGRVFYQRSDLLEYLLRSRVEATPK